MSVQSHSLRSETHRVKNPHEKMEVIISHKKASLIAKFGLPTRIYNLLESHRNERDSAEILAYTAFPYLSHDKDLDQESGRLRQLLYAGLYSGSLGSEQFFDTKTAVQHLEHLTEHTRMALLNLLDEKRNQ